MGVLIDASVFIEIERSGGAWDTSIAGLEEEPAGMSAVTAAEMLHGVYRAKDPQIRLRRERFVDRIIQLTPIVEFDLEAARVYARLWAELAARGELVGVHDLQIAASAIAMSFQVMTSNVRDFLRIPGLQIRHWNPRPQK